jgi:hypothetical protein
LRRTFALGLTVVLFGALIGFVGAARAQLPAAGDSDPLATARDTEPVVLTGANFPGLAVPADVTAKVPTVGGAQCLINEGGAGNTQLTPDSSCTHNTYEDPDASSSDVTNAAGIEGPAVDRLLGYRWNGTAFEQIPFQVDEMFVRYLSNNASGFAFYSETDQHTAYAFDREGFRWTDDQKGAKPDDPMAPCIAQPASEVAKDPVQGLDSDDELVFMARDAGGQAAADAPMPKGIEQSFEVTVVDPLTGDTGYVYVMQSGEDGPAPAFDASNGYVRYERDDPEDHNVFLYSQSSYSGYGAAPKGAWYDPKTDTCRTDEKKQRRPSDAATITTPRYRFRYDGRWLMTNLEVNNADTGSTIAPAADTTYGPDLVDQWKARAFQQRPSGETPCCGFEEEVNNWGGSSILMGELSGPVRTIRETWGADSGTNVVRREIFYRNEIRFGSFLRVHVIPPLDGIYAQWDYNAGVVDTYYNPFNSGGVPIDGKNDERFGNSRIHAGRDGVSYEGDDELSDAAEQAAGEEGKPITVGDPKEPGCPYAGQPLEDQWDVIRNDPRWPEQLRDQFPSDLIEACVYNDIDSPDPSFSGVNAGLNWEEIAGSNGTLVLRTALKHFTPGGGAVSLVSVPYYRDDACFDDGTGSDPGPHLHGRGVDDGNFAKQPDGSPRVCWDSANPEHPDIPGADPRFFQGSIGTHGVHILLIADSDNAGQTVPLTEVDAEQRMVVLTGDPGNVGDTYGRHSEKPLLSFVRPEDRAAGGDTPTPTPTPSGTSTPTPTPTPSSTVSPRPTGTAAPSPKPSGSPKPSASSSPSARPSQSPTKVPGTINTTITSDFSEAVADDEVMLSGQVTASKGCDGPFDVSILRRIHGSDSFDELARVRAENGLWSFEWPADYNSSFTAKPVSSKDCTGQSATPVDVMVKVKISTRTPRRCTQGSSVKGSIAPNHTGTQVTLKRKIWSGWKTVDRAVLDGRSEFALKLPACSGRYRIDWTVSDPRNLANTSRFRL